MGVIFTTGFAFNAYADASTAIPAKGGHAESRISGYAIDISFELSQKNPERIAALILEILSGEYLKMLEPNLHKGYTIDGRVLISITSKIIFKI